MAPFHFRLEQVLRYRKQLEEEAMQSLAEATNARETTKKRIENINIELIVARETLLNFSTMDAGERYVATTYEVALREEKKTALFLLQEQNRVVDARRQALIVKAQERSLLDKLKEKQTSRHAHQEYLNEQKTNDETATLRYKHPSF